MPPKNKAPSSSEFVLLFGDLDLALVDLIDDVVGRLAVDGASDGLSGTEDLLDGTFQLARHRAVTHDAGDVDDLIERNVAAVLNVLDLLAVTWRLLESADEESGSAGNHAHRRLTILDRQFDRYTETWGVGMIIGLNSNKKQN